MPLDDTNCAATYKILIMGDNSVGKTAILNSLTGREFKEVLAPTVGSDFVRKIVEVDGALVQLVIWDSSGQPRFRSMTRNLYKGVQGLILVYDVTDPDSLNTLNFWLQSVQEEILPTASQYEPIPYVVCGNKSDLVVERRVTTEKGKKFADSNMSFGFFETSAKTGHNVFAAFHRLAFEVTDIYNPRLMKSYHPHQLRPLSKHNCLEQLADKSKVKGKKKSKAKDVVEINHEQQRAYFMREFQNGDQPKDRFSRNGFDCQQSDICSSENGGHFEFACSKPDSKQKRRSKISSKERPRSSINSAPSSSSCLFCCFVGKKDKHS